MKILFILENTIEHLEGGTEVSSFHLARLLRKQQVNVREWSPYKKRFQQIFYTSVIGQIIIFFKLLLYVLSWKPDVFHIQGKYMVPPAVILGKLLGIPTVVTIRDYIALCPIGLCLFEQPIRHGFFYFVSKEIPRFIAIYHFGISPIGKVFKTILLIRGWLVSGWMRFWIKSADEVVAVSCYVKNTLSAWNINSSVILNSIDMALAEQYAKNAVRSHTILFVGKPSYGKGYDLFQQLSTSPEFKTYEFRTVGGSGKETYSSTIRRMAEAEVVVAPSRWQEPFGRVALEAIFAGTPVLATDCGGLPEIVENGMTGYVASPTLDSLRKMLEKLLFQKERLYKSIVSEKQALAKKFQTDPTDQHVFLYKRIVNRKTNRL